VRVNVIVKPKEAVLDPQGNTVRDAMRHLGMPEVRSVRIGKFMEIEVDGDNGEIEKRLHGLCRDLLSNPVIEDYELRRPPASGPSRTETKATARRTDVTSQRSAVPKKKK
jgi:phosphoribosylformylglycinamidine synthase subunit PurS